MGKKFIKVNSDEITRYKFLYSNSSMSYDNSELLSKLFNENGVPEEYQYLFFYKPRLDPITKEFIGGAQFRVIIEKNSIIKAILITKHSDNNLTNFYMYSVDSKENDCSKKDIRSFYSKMYESGHLKNYFNAINEYFLLDIDLDYLFELSESGKSLSEQKKLLNKRLK